MKLKSLKTGIVYDIIDISEISSVLISSPQEGFIQRRVNTKLIGSHYRLVENNEVGRVPDPEDIIVEVIAESTTPSNNLIHLPNLHKTTVEKVQKSKTTKNKEKTSRALKQTISDTYTLKDLCTEINITPSKARSQLRSKKIEKPSGSWEWKNREDATQIIEILKG